jgi:large subunit ribosomal protein L10
VAINRARKEELVAQYDELLRDTDGFIIVHTKGLTVKQVQELRAKIREADGDYVTTKLTLFRIALENAGWKNPEEHLHGPVSVAFGKGNFPGVAKAILDFTKNLEDKLQVKGGVMTGDVLDGTQVESISKLPSLEELRSQLAGLVVQPATGLVSVLNAATGAVVNVLQAYVQDQEDGDAA